MDFKPKFYQLFIPVYGLMSNKPFEAPIKSLPAQQP